MSAIFALEQWADTHEIWIERMKHESACQALLRNSFQLDPSDRSTGLAQVARAAETARRIPVYAMDYPRQYDWLPRAAAAILAHCAVAADDNGATASAQSNPEM